MTTKEDEKRQTCVPLPDEAPAEAQPIKPLEPPANTQPEIPKVGTADAPGG